MKEVTLRRLAAIQPICHFRYLKNQIVEALAQESGIPANDLAYAPLTRIQERIDLASVDWGALSLSLETRAMSDAGAIDSALNYARLLLDRAEIQAALYVDAKHFFTLSLTTNHRYRLPRAVPKEKLSEWEDFQFSMRLGDTFLDEALATLKEFENLLQQGVPFSQMRSALNQAYELLLSYQRAREYGNRIFEALCAELTLVVRERETLVA